MQGHNLNKNFYNFAPDEPRDERGRWTDGGSDIASQLDALNPDDWAALADIGDIGIGDSSNTSNGAFNVKNAVQYINDNAESASTGYCASYVRDALNNEKGGNLDVQPPNDGGHGYAKNYGQSLVDAGFQAIATSKHYQNAPSSYPPTGYNSRISLAYLSASQPNVCFFALEERK